MEFSGHFIGFINDFTAYGELETAIGNVSSDITLHESDDNYTFGGKLITDQFDLGTFYSIDKMGTLSSNLAIEGSGLSKETVSAEIDGVISEIGFNDYAYHNIEVAGDFKNSFFNGQASIFDENLFMTFDGKIDFTRKTPVFSFVSDIDNLDLVDLNFLKDEIYSSVSGKVEADFSGLDLNNLEGTVRVTDLSYCNEEAECRLDSVFAEAYSDSLGRYMGFRSSIASGYVQGNYDIEGLQASLFNVVSEIIPSFEPIESKSELSQKFDLELTIHDYEVINDFFTSDIMVAANTRVAVGMDESGHDFNCTIYSDSIFYEEYHLAGSTIDARRQDSAIYFTVISDELFATEAFTFGDFSIDGRSEDDTLFLASAWQSPQQQHGGDINGQFTIRGNKNFDFVFNSSYLDLAGQHWQFDPNARISMDSTRIEVNNLHLVNGEQFVKVNGIIDENPRSILNIDFNQFDVANLNPLIADQNVALDGEINGHGYLQDLYNRVLFTSDLGISQFVVNEYDIGDILVDSNWNTSEQRLKMEGSIERDGVNSMEFEGFYTPRIEDSPLDIDVRFNSFQLSFINGFIAEGISDIHGSVSGDIKMEGRPEEPQLNGLVDFESVDFTVDYLNTTYAIEESAGVDPNWFTLDGIQIIDQEGNKALLVGTIAHENFSQWNFDAAVFIEEDHFLCMNTTSSDNSLYYGKAYGMGDIYISGFEDQLDMEIMLSTGPNTVVNLPLDGSEDVDFEDFVIFINDEEQEEEDVDLSGINMYFFT